MATVIVKRARNRNVRKYVGQRMIFEIFFKILPNKGTVDAATG